MRPAGERTPCSVGSLCRPGISSAPVQLRSEASLAPAGLRDCCTPLGGSDAVILRDAKRTSGEREPYPLRQIVYDFAPWRDEVFCDSGSRCYTRSAERRNLDRSTRAHNTLMVDEAEQNILGTDPSSLFQCGNEAVVSRITISEGDEQLRASHQGYSRFGVEHQRTVRLSGGACMCLTR